MDEKTRRAMVRSSLQALVSNCEVLLGLFAEDENKPTEVKGVPAGCSHTDKRDVSTLGTNETKQHCFDCNAVFVNGIEQE